MTPADVRKRAELLRIETLLEAPNDGETADLLDALADVYEAAKDRCAPTDRSFQKFLADEERLRSALAHVDALPLARVEALKP